jgi:hypothetical protein
MNTHIHTHYLEYVAYLNMERSSKSVAKNPINEGEIYAFKQMFYNIKSALGYLVTNCHKVVEKRRERRVKYKLQKQMEAGYRRSCLLFQLLSR